MRLPLPEELDRLSPREAFALGDAYGREQLAAALRADADAAKAAEGSEASKSRDRRLADLEERVIVLQGEVADGARFGRDILRRLVAVEGRVP